MNLKVNFTSKLTKSNTANSIVFVKDNKIKNKFLNPITKSILNNQKVLNQYFHSQKNLTFFYN